MKQYFRRSVALTHEHGSWVFLLSPLLIGLFAGGEWSVAHVYLVVAALCGFLIRHPIVIAVKAYSGRRSRHDLPAARFWISVYGAIGLLMVAGLVLRGYGYLLYLVLPGLPVFGWHLWLVRRRAERRQAGVEIIASGVLALSAPAAYWVSVGSPEVTGWWLWILTWLQSAASIVYAYLRLEQRDWNSIPDAKTRLKFGRRALLYVSFNLIFVMSLSIARILPLWIFLPYTLQFGETLWGTFHPAVALRPSKIGIRQLIVSSLFTLLFILTWNIPT